MLRKKRGYFFGCTVAHNFVVNFLRFKLCLLFAENTHDRGKFHYMTDVLLDCFGYDQTSRNNVNKINRRSVISLMNKLKRELKSRGAETADTLSTSAKVI